MISIITQMNEEQFFRFINFEFGGYFPEDFSNKVFELLESKGDNKVFIDDIEDAIEEIRKIERGANE